jgi:oxygen-independent coproporphyrinogen-3 oxidase
VQFDAAIIGKLSMSGPRYTSYPTADRFTPDFGYGNFLEAWPACAARQTPAAVAVCAHAVLRHGLLLLRLQQDRHQGPQQGRHLPRLPEAEIAMQGKLFAGMNSVEQLHFGGGTPTYLSDAQMGDLMAHLRALRFRARRGGRVFDRDRSAHRRCGAHAHAARAGLQPHQPGRAGLRSRRAEGRQPHPAGGRTNRAIIDAARDAGFRSISIDLIYGLPKQTWPDHGADAGQGDRRQPGPHRAVQLRAHAAPVQAAAPHPDADLPTPRRQARHAGAVHQPPHRAAGYVYIGMDHFAKPDDELAVAQRQGRLHRNFQGYSTHAETDLVACGVSAISAVGATYSQNEKDAGRVLRVARPRQAAVARGYKLDTDDLLRRIVIQMLMCNFELSITSIDGMAYPIRFRAVLRRRAGAAAGAGARRPADHRPGLDHGDAKGRLLIRNICMVFDRYLNRRRAAASARQPLRYSKTI